MKQERNHIVRTFIILAAVILCAAAVSSCAVILNEQQKRSEPIVLEKRIESAAEKAFQFVIAHADLPFSTMVTEKG